MVIGKWKLVNEIELYDISVDRIESNDLSKTNPEQFKYMLEQWNKRDNELNKGLASTKRKVKKARKN